MTLPDRTGPSKPHRLGLYGPFIVALAAALVLTTHWFWLASQVTARMDDHKAHWASEGWSLHWGQRDISGFPFRLFIVLRDVKFSGPFGWAASIPVIKAEASVFAIGHWVALAPQGAVFHFPGGGPVGVQGRILRASASDLGAHPPSLSAEGVDLIFTPQAGAPRFALKTAQEFHFHCKAGPSDQGAFYLSYDGEDAAGAKAHSVVDGIYTHAAALKGPDWQRAVNAWELAGGRLTLRQPPAPRP